MRGVLEAYRRVLRNRPLSRLLLGEFVSSIGDWLYLVALLIIVYTRTQDAVLLGVVGRGPGAALRALLDPRRHPCRPRRPPAHPAGHRPCPRRLDVRAGRVGRRQRLHRGHRRGDHRGDLLLVLLRARHRCLPAHPGARRVRTSVRPTRPTRRSRTWPSSWDRRWPPSSCRSPTSPWPSPSMASLPAHRGRAVDVAVVARRPGHVVSSPPWTRLPSPPRQPTPRDRSALSARRTMRPFAPASTGAAWPCPSVACWCSTWSKASCSGASAC